MRRIALGLAWLACLFLVGTALGGEASPSLITASGTVSKAADDSLTIRPRGADGKFGKSIVLKLTGTSKITALSQQKRAGKLVFVQNDVAAKDLKAHQPIAVIYAVAGKNAVLLSAVTTAGSSK